eukprot:5427770-Amphidinium_carterae.1
MQKVVKTFEQAKVVNSYVFVRMLGGCFGFPVCSLYCGRLGCPYLGQQQLPGCMYCLKRQRTHTQSQETIHEMSRQ